MNPYKRLLKAVTSAFSRLMSFYQELFLELSNEIIDLRCILLVIKGYSLDYIKSRENDFKIAFIEESENYKQTIERVESSIERVRESNYDLNHYADQITKNSKDIEGGFARKCFDFFHKEHHDLNQIVDKFNTFIVRMQKHSMERVTGLLTGAGDAAEHETEIISLFEKVFKNLNDGFEQMKEGQQYLATIKAAVNEIEAKIKENIHEEEILDTDKDEEISEVLDHVKHLDDLDEFEDLDLDGIEPISDEEMDKLGIDEGMEGVIIEDGGPAKDGDIQIRIVREGIFVDITPAYNGGFPIRAKDIEGILNSKKIPLPNQTLLKNICKNAGQGFVKIGEWEPNAEYDANVDIKVSKDQLFAYMKISPPKFSGRMVDMKDLQQELEANNIRYGIKEEPIKEMVDNELFNTFMLIAEGFPPEQGDNARFEYNFKTDFSEMTFEQDESGRIDFREMNLIQNVVIDQVLARKIPPTLGKPGKNVYNEEIPPRPGDDAELKLGHNVKYSDDGMQIIATQNGHAQLKEDIISVEPVFVVEGDVDYSVGNISFLGGVLVLGNVLDGFKIEASGDVEVKGTVGKSNIMSENNVVIAQGILGKEEGYVRAGHNIITKFIENGNVQSGNDIIVAREILNSKVIANKRLICSGKKASIVGGRVYAGEEVFSRNLGSDYFVPTIVEVGIPPNIKEKYQFLQDEKTKVNEEMINIQKVFDVLKKIEATKGSLPPDKEAIKKKAIASNLHCNSRLQEIEEELNEIKQTIENYNISGHVIVLDNVYPEVTINIHNGSYKTKNLEKKMRYILDEGEIVPRAIGKEHVQSAIDAQRIMSSRNPKSVMKEMESSASKNKNA